MFLRRVSVDGTALRRCYHCSLESEGCLCLGDAAAGVEKGLLREMRYHRSSKTPSAARMMHGVLVLALLQCKLGCQSTGYGVSSGPFGVTLCSLYLRSLGGAKEVPRIVQNPAPLSRCVFVFNLSASKLRK